MSLSKEVYGLFYSCHGYPYCKTTLNEKSKKTRLKNMVTTVLSVMKRRLNRKGPSSDFYSCEDHPKCKCSYSAAAETCPEWE